MIITPDNEAYLLKAPLEIDELHQLDFANATAQANYFQSLPKLALMRITYQRENGTLVVPFNIEQIRSYNYVMYKNKNYGNKWFYAFITGMSYESNTVTSVGLKTDVFQTYMFDYSWKKSYIKRETVADDTFGKHILPEDVDTGDYIVNHSKTQFESVCETGLTQQGNANTPLIVVQCSEKVGVVRTSASGGAEVDDTYIIGSMPQGCYYYFFENLPDGNSSYGYGEFIKFRNHLDSIGKGEAIMNLFLVPKKSGSFLYRVLYMYDKNGNESSTAISVLEPSASTYGAYTISSPTYARPTTIGSYTPHNNKLFTSQFNYFCISNYAGTMYDFHWEDFRNIATGAIQTPSFRINGVISASTSFAIQPMNSMKSEVDSYGNKISTEFIAGATLPTLSWASDYYLNWLAMNGSKLDAQIDTAWGNIGGEFMGNAFSGAVEGFTTGGVAGAVAGGLLSGGATLFDTIPAYKDTVDEVEETKRLQNLIPNTVSGNRNAGDLMFSMNSVGFAFINYQIREDVARKIDSYFDMFGYRVNEIKTPNTKTRSKWNFLQTNVCNLTGDIPQEALIELKNMYNAGITIWHDPAHFLDYDQTNSIV